MASPGKGWQQRAIWVKRLPTPTTVKADLAALGTLRGRRGVVSAAGGSLAARSSSNNARPT